MIDPHAEGKELDPAINNPLSQAEEVRLLMKSRASSAEEEWLYFS